MESHHLHTATQGLSADNFGRREGIRRDWPKNIMVSVWRQTDIAGSDDRASVSGGAMKIIKAVVQRKLPPRWGYLTLMVSMLYLLRRARIKDIPRENVLSFFAAMLPTELSHNMLAINFAIIYKLHKSKQPVLSEWVGSIGALLQCIVMARLAKIYRDNISSKHLIRDTMHAFDISSDSVQSIGKLSWKQWFAVLLPVPQPLGLAMAFPGVSKIQTVTFAHVGKNKTTALLMDVYKHPNTPSNAPIVLYIHGGAWVMSTRETPPLPCIYQIAASGWVVCVFDYQKSPKIAFPEQLVDAKRAMAFLRRNARKKFDANPDYIVVAGESAGGHLASLMALTPADKSLQPGFEEVDTSVRGCIDTYGVHDFKDRHGVYFYKDKDHIFVRFIELLVMQKKMSDADEDWEKASPVGWLREEKSSDLPAVIPPFLISHGTLDTLVPFGSSQVFFEQLQLYRQRAQQTPVGGVCDIFLKIPGAHHAFNYVMSPRAIAHGQAVAAFLNNLYAKTKDIPLHCASELATAQIAELAAAATTTATARL